MQPAHPEKATSQATRPTIHYKCTSNLIAATMPKLRAVCVCLAKLDFKVKPTLTNIYRHQTLQKLCGVKK